MLYVRTYVRMRADGETRAIWIMACELWKGTREVVSCSLHPESQSEKNKSAYLWGNFDEIYDEIYDEMRLRTVKNCLARLEGCWDPEFETRLEEIMDYRWDMAILSVRFLWRVRRLRGFPCFYLGLNAFLFRLPDGTKYRRLKLLKAKRGLILKAGHWCQLLWSPC